MDTLASMAAALPERSNQRKVILAAVAASHSRGDVQEHIPIGKDLWKTSETNAAFLLHGHELETPTMTKQKYRKDVVEDAVSHILARTQQESWGSTDYHMTNLTTAVTTSAGVALWKPGDSKKVNIPCMRRESGLNASWRDYFTSHSGKDAHIGGKALRDLQKALTASQSKARTGVNNVGADLLHDPLIRLGRIVDAAHPLWSKKKMLACLKCFFLSGASNEPRHERKKDFTF